jgi:predicted AlkP superfamily pyrophosphatase or phosphodiesterase
MSTSSACEPRRALCGAGLVALMMACAPTPPPAGSRGIAAAPGPSGPVRHVVVVTIDGLMPEAYLHPEAHGLKLPVLRRLVAEGASSDGALSVFPTVTYPAHTSIASGVSPGRHGVVSNAAFDPLDQNQEAWRWYDEEVKVPRVWDVARSAGYTTALIRWPSTVGESATFHVPEVWRSRTSDDLKLVRSLSTPGLFERVAAAYPDFESGIQPPSVTDAAAVDIASVVLETKPHLMFLHLVQVDSAQHQHGLFGPEALAAMENADAQIGRLLAAAEKAGISRELALVVASDHGFAEVTRQINPNALLRQAGLIEVDGAGKPRDWQAAVLPGAGSAYVYLRRPEDAALQAATRRVFEDAVAAGNSGINRILSREAIRASGGDPEAFLALEAELGTYFGRGRDTYDTKPPYRATHGYSPERPEMKASLILFGPAVAQGRLVDARLVDVAPTVAGWLGLELGAVDGKRLEVVPTAPAASP